MTETKTLLERLASFAGDARVTTFNGSAGQLLMTAGALTAEAVTALDAKDALLREARGELDRMVEHFGTWADDHPTDATTETWSALHCARALLLKLTEAAK